MMKSVMIAAFVLCLNLFSFATEGDCGSYPESLDTGKQELLFYLDHDRLKVLTNDKNQEKIGWSLGQYWIWEGGSSRFVAGRGIKIGFDSGQQLITEPNDKDTTSTVYCWHIDVRGPDWIDVSLTQKDSALVVDARRYAQVDHNIWVKHREYKSYNDLIQSRDEESLELKDMVMGLMGRMGEEHRVLDVSLMKRLFFHQVPECTDETRKVILELVSQLNDDSWKVRDAASCKLMNPDLLVYFDDTVKDMDLTAEQRSRKDQLDMYNQITLPVGLAQKLVRLCTLNEDPSLSGVIVAAPVSPTTKPTQEVANDDENPT